MASTDKTPKLGLNQWAAGDDVLRADFNADNAKIDAGVAENARAAAAAALAASNAVMKFSSAIFRGDGTEKRNVDFGFTPKLLIISCPTSSAGIAILSASVVFERYGSTFNVYPASLSSIKLTGTGFCLTSASSNSVDRDGFYIAIG